MVCPLKYFFDALVFLLFILRTAISRAPSLKVVELSYSQLMNAIMTVPIVHHCTLRLVRLKVNTNTVNMHRGPHIPPKHWHTVGNYL